MSERFTCDDVRDRAFEYRRGELEADKRESVEAHLERCAACRDYVEKLFTLMSSTPDIEEPTSQYADALFAGIADRIEREELGTEQSDEHGEVQFAPAAPRFRWGTAAIGLAAGFVLAVGIGWLLSVTGTFSADDSVEQGEVARETAVPEPEEPGEASQSPAKAQTFATLRPQPSRRAGVGILASEGAVWSLRGDDDVVLELERGTVLVEYLPRDGRQFRVEAPGMQVRVVGTIFYVSANGESTAGVVTGAVEIQTNGDEPMELEEGQRVTAGGQVEAMPPDDAEALRSQVDVRRHHAALRQRMEPEGGEKNKRRASSSPRTATAEAETQSTREARPTPEANADLSDPLARRRAKAEAAIRDGDYERARSIYEKLLRELDASHPAAPSIHLDLAGLYLEQMNQPRKALPYLREFLRKWPNDVASTAVQRRLCTVSDELGIDEPRCDSRTPTR